MPRRPLFCRTCTDLLDQLSRAAEAVVAAGSCASEPSTQTRLPSAIKTTGEMRSRYLEIWLQAQKHLEFDHACGRTAGDLASLGAVSSESQPQQPERAWTH